MSSVQSVIHCQHGSGQTAILLSIIVTAIIYSNSIHIINTIHIVEWEYNLGGENLWYVTKYVSCSLNYLWCFWTNFNFLLSLATEYILFLILEQIELNFPLCSQPYSQIKYIRYPPWGIFIRLCLFIFTRDTWALLLQLWFSPRSNQCHHKNKYVLWAKYVKYIASDHLIHLSQY